MSESSRTELSDEQIAAAVREKAGLGSNPAGLADEYIVAGVRGFAREFHYWYNRVLEAALPQYRKLLVDRVNPMIRGMQLQGLPSSEVARRLVADYAHRNFVTAGGWALEQLAIASSPRLRKSSAEGIDAEWHEPGSQTIVNLYVIKSGTVTRNSDILKALKNHGQVAQKRLLQTDKKAVVRVHYVVTSGQKSSTFHDGVYRPSSAEFWAEAFAIADETKAVDLVLAMAQTAGSLLPRPTNFGATSALETAVATFIADPSNATAVDWEFLARRNMVAESVTKAEEALRHERAVAAVAAEGFRWPLGASARKKKGIEVRAVPIAAGEESSAS